MHLSLELMLHETAMAWVRDRLKKTVPKVAWEETVEEFGARLKEVAIHIEREYEVAALCRALPGRVAQLNERKGGHIPKEFALPREDRRTPNSEKDAHPAHASPPPHIPAN